MECTVELTLKDTNIFQLLEPVCNLLKFTVAPKVFLFYYLKPLTMFHLVAWSLIGHIPCAASSGECESSFVIEAQPPNAPPFCCFHRVILF